MTKKRKSLARVLLVRPQLLLVLLSLSSLIFNVSDLRNEENVRNVFPHAVYNSCYVAWVISVSFPQ